MSPSSDWPSQLSSCYFYFDILFVSQDQHPKSCITDTHMLLLPQDAPLHKRQLLLTHGFQQLPASCSERFPLGTHTLGSTWLNKQQKQCLFSTSMWPCQSSHLSTHGVDSRLTDLASTLSLKLCIFLLTRLLGNLMHTVPLSACFSHPQRSLLVPSLYLKRHVVCYLLDAQSNLHYLCYSFMDQ